jgi:hypothetical protein
MAERLPKAVEPYGRGLSGKIGPEGFSRGADRPGLARPSLPVSGRPEQGEQGGAPGRPSPSQGLAGPKEALRPKGDPGLEERVKEAWPGLTERERRLFAAREAKLLGYGGITQVAAVCGLSRATITKGLKELANPAMETGRIRKPGAGRPTLSQSDPELLDLLAGLIGDGEAGPDPLAWTFMSTRTLAAELSVRKHPASYVKVGQLLKELGYKLQGNKKLGRGRELYHPEADRQFSYISQEVKAAWQGRRPAIFLESRQVKGHGPGGQGQADGGEWAASKGRGPGLEEGQSDSGAYAAWALGRWWEREGQNLFGNIPSLFLAVDETATDMHGHWRLKIELTRLSSLMGAPIQVSYFPPGTVKWKARLLPLFAFRSSSYLGEPLRFYQTAAFLLSQEDLDMPPPESLGFLDHREIKDGPLVSEGEKQLANVCPGQILEKWNYCIRPGSFDI